MTNLIAVVGEAVGTQRQLGGRVMPNAGIERRCADCGCRIGRDNGPPDGWQLEDGRTVCHACCVADLGLIVRRAIFMHNAQEGGA